MSSIFFDLDEHAARAICENAINIRGKLSESYVDMYVGVILSSMNWQPEEMAKYFEDVARISPTTFGLLVNAYEMIESSFFCISLLSAVARAIPHIASMPMFYKIRLERLVGRLLKKALSENTGRETLMCLLYLFKNIEYLGRQGYILKTKIRGVDAILRIAETLPPKTAYLELRNHWQEQLLGNVRAEIANYFAVLSDFLLDPELRRLANISLSECFNFRVVLPEKSARAYLELLRDDVLDSPEKAYIVLNDVLRTQMLVIAYSISNVLSQISENLRNTILFDVSPINLRILRKIEPNTNLGKRILEICMGLHDNLRNATRNVKTLSREKADRYLTLLGEAKKLIAILMENATFLLNETKSIVSIPKIGDDWEIRYETKRRSKDILALREETLGSIQRFRDVLLEMNSILEEEIKQLREALESVVRISAYLATLDPMIMLTKKDIDNVLGYINNKNLWLYIESYYRRFSKQTLGDMIKKIPEIKPPEFA